MIGLNIIRLLIYRYIYLFQWVNSNSLSSFFMFTNGVDGSFQFDWGVKVSSFSKIHSARWFKVTNTKAIEN